MVNMMYTGVYMSYRTQIPVFLGHPVYGTKNTENMGENTHKTFPKRYKNCKNIYLY